ncbi:hypothetical protein LOC67_13610 [Stieleria sp. JC731]|uniref:hypothetical protein n=1 Tax=Pirellulaceae TaxID=2691357 RepID=UPI001E2E5E56|nr:hypothetical protein [Stieleria sp. JC731]MCC9601589.1 hypothetical protein [Stieleria sp. JC731]
MTSNSPAPGRKKRYRLKVLFCVMVGIQLSVLGFLVERSRSIKRQIEAASTAVNEMHDAVDRMEFIGQRGRSHDRLLPQLLEPCRTPEEMPRLDVPFFVIAARPRKPMKVYVPSGEHFLKVQSPNEDEPRLIPLAGQCSYLLDFQTPPDTPSKLQLAIDGSDRHFGAMTIDLQLPSTWYVAQLNRSEVVYPNQINARSIISPQGSPDLRPSVTLATIQPDRHSRESGANWIAKVSLISNGPSRIPATLVDNATIVARDDWLGDYLGDGTYQVYVPFTEWPFAASN